MHKDLISFKLPRPGRGFHQLLANRKGVAAIEIALIAPILLILTVGIVDFGMAIQARMQVQSAAQAGADYAMLHGFDANKITAAVTNATTNTGITATPAPAQTCGCASGTTVTDTPCGTTCADGSNVGTFVTISAQAAYTTILPYPGMANSFNFSALTEVRIQ